MIKLTDKIKNHIKAVNDHVNGTVRYQADKHTYGVGDLWAFPKDGIGDCEDIAIAKQRLLKESEIESWLACCWTPSKQYHVVLALETDQGSFILDNRYPGVLRYEDLRYKWDKIEQANEKWFKVVSGLTIKTGKETKAPKGYINFKAGEER